MAKQKNYMTLKDIDNALAKIKPEDEIICWIVEKKFDGKFFKDFSNPLNIKVHAVGKKDV